MDKVISDGIKKMTACEKVHRINPWPKPPISQRPQLRGMGLPAQKEQSDKHEYMNLGKIVHTADSEGLIAIP